MEAELTLGKGDQDSERELSCLEGAERVWKWVILSIACFVYCCVSGVWHTVHNMYLLS